MLRRDDLKAWAAVAVLVALFVGVLACPPVFAQSQVFADDGEGTRPAAGWSGAGCTTVTRAADGGAPKFGVGMIQCNLGVQELALNSWAYGSEFLVRYWFRYDANVDHKAGSKQMRIGFQSPSEIIAACQFENGNAATLFVSVNNRASFWGNRTAPCGDRQWHKLEIARRDNGPLKMWVDDQPVTGTPTDWANAGGHVGALYIPSNWSQNPGWEHDSLNLLYIDGLRIYSDQGTTVSGSIMDGTVGESGAAPPPPPPPPVDPVDPVPPPAPTCASAPLVVTGVAWPGTAEGARSGRFTWSVAGLVVTLQSFTFEQSPARLRVTDSRGCSVTVTR